MTGSTTLDHQLAGAAVQDNAAEREQPECPERLKRDYPEQGQAGALAEPDVDRRLDDRGEREGVRDLAQPVREEPDRYDHPGEEEDDRDRQRHHPAVVEEPERRGVVEEPDPEADDDRQAEAD